MSMCANRWMCVSVGGCGCGCVRAIGICVRLRTDTLVLEPGNCVEQSFTSFPVN